MLKNFLIVCAVLLTLGGVGEGVTVIDQSSSKNELLVKGATPHVRFADDDATGDFSILVNGGVMKFTGLNAAQLFNYPWDGTVGVELEEPQSVAVSATAGGSLTASINYYIVVTALDGSGETIASSEVVCTTDVVNKTCHVTWSATPPPAASYNIYYGLSTGNYTKFYNTAALFYDLAVDAGASGQPPVVTTAYQVKIANDGIHFPDGSIQITAGGASTWMFNGLHILNTTSGNVGIFDGRVFTPAALLNVVSETADSAVFVDVFGSGMNTEVGFRYARGIFNTPLTTGAGDAVGRVVAIPWDGSAYAESAYMQFFAGTNPFSGVDHGTGVEWYTTAVASTTPTLRLRLFPSGNVNIGSSSSDPGVALKVQGYIIGASMAHVSAKDEEGSTVLVPLTFGATTTVLTSTSGTFSGSNKVRISASAQGSGDSINTGSTIMSMFVLRDGTNLVGDAEVTWDAATGTSKNKAPWSIHVEVEETPPAGAHTYVVQLRPNGTDPGSTGYNALYVVADELP